MGASKKPSVPFKNKAGPRHTLVKSAKRTLQLYLTEETRRRLAHLAYLDSLTCGGRPSQSDVVTRLVDDYYAMKEKEAWEKLKAKAHES